MCCLPCLASSGKTGACGLYRHVYDAQALSAFVHKRILLDCKRCQHQTLAFQSCKCLSSAGVADPAGLCFPTGLWRDCTTGYRAGKCSEGECRALACLDLAPEHGQDPASVSHQQRLVCLTSSLCHSPTTRPPVCSLRYTSTPCAPPPPLPPQMTQLFVLVSLVHSLNHSYGCCLRGVAISLSSCSLVQAPTSAKESLSLTGCWTGKPGCKGLTA